jgi:hypothetical protein
MSRSIDRRRMMGVGLSALAASLAGCVSATPSKTAGGPFGRVIVDTSPMNANGSGELGANIRPMVAQAVTAALRGRTGVRGAPDVVVTVKSVTLALYGGLGGGGGDPMFRFGFNDSPSDFIDATVSVVRGREVLDSFPVLANQPASFGGPVVDPRSEWRRVQALIEALAYWIGKRLA